MTYDILIVNYNTLQDTRKLIEDLRDQTLGGFTITLVDQFSSEPKTAEFLIECRDKGITVIENDFNMPLCGIWNNFVKKSNAEMISIINSDVRVPNNYIEHNTLLLKKDDIDCVLHPTNSLKYQTVRQSLQFHYANNHKIMQGWDFTLRREVYRQIPASIKFYCGDDYLFEHMDYKNIVFAINSPIIHQHGKTKKSKYTKDKISSVCDIHAYKELGFPHHRKMDSRYCNLTPTFREFIYE
jgi:hypothetical protein